MSLSESEPEVLVSPFRYWKKLKPVATPKPILKRPSASMGGGQAKKQKVSAGDSDGSQSEDPFFFTLGTDASGFENGMRAALVANLSPQLVFTCEKDKKLRELIRVTYKPITSYVDMTTRNNHKAPTVQLFITSPNCQSYSTNGKLSGIEDDRGKHLIHTLDYVKVQQPKVMILEEVPGLATMLKFQKTWKHVLKSLKKYGYTVDWSILDAYDYYLPQHRPRLYLVAIHGTKMRDFVWPKPISDDNRIPIAKLLEPKRKKNVKAAPHHSKTNQDSLTACMQEIRAAHYRPDKDNIIIDLDGSASYRQWQVEKSPCLTATRGRQGGYYVTTRQRRFTLNEMFRLQGIIPEEVAWNSVKGLSHQMMGHAIGNAFPVSVMCHLIPEALYAAGIIHSIPLNQFQEKKGDFFKQSK